MAVERSNGIFGIVWMLPVEAIFNVALLIAGLLLWDHHFIGAEINMPRNASLGRWSGSQ